MTLSPEIVELRRTDPVVNAVMCLGERDGLSDVEVLTRMVVELAKCNNARLEALISVSRERPPLVQFTRTGPPPNATWNGEPVYVPAITESGACPASLRGDKA